MIKIERIQVCEDPGPVYVHAVNSRISVVRQDTGENTHEI